MKHQYRIRIPLLALCGFLAACGAGGDGVFPPASPSPAWKARLPALPPAWKSILGEPEWRLEWLNRDGKKEEAVIRGGAQAAINPPETWTSPVIAWPRWPNRGIPAGVFRPAGALFPFDASGETISLSWRGGVDAVLYWELARASAAEEAAAPSRAAVPRLPVYFNWPRFRELFAEGSGINEEVRRDPWLADWPLVAEKTARSGFDKRRLVPAARKKLSVPVGPGPWRGTSPFAEPLRFEGQPEFPVGETVDVWISVEGLLRCNTAAWILLPWN